MDFDFKLPGLGRAESSRPKRVAEAVKNELTLLLLQKTRDPRLTSATIARVEMTPDIKRATVFFYLPPGGNTKKALQGFEKAKGFFRSQLAARLNLRYTPELIFRYDRGNEKLEHLDELFRQIAEEEKTDDDQP